MLLKTEDPTSSQPLPVAPADLEELARWVPSKGMNLLTELCERARRDPDLARPRSSPVLGLRTESGADAGPKYVSVGQLQDCRQARGDLLEQRAVIAKALRAAAA